MRWNLQQDKLVLTAADPHTDSIELSGRGCSLMLGYGTGVDGELILSRRAVFPTLRLAPNVTEATFICDIPADAALHLDTSERERAVAFTFDGVFTARSRLGSLSLLRTFIPDSSALGFWEELRVQNTGTQSVAVQPCRSETMPAQYGRGVYGIYEVQTQPENSDAVTLAPGAQVIYRAHTAAHIYGKPWPEPLPFAQELQNRRDRMQALQGQAILKTGDAALDTMFRLCKLHAAETIFDTLVGPLHSPGGCEYYAASWTNDQVEYAGPWFAFAGDALAKQAALNAYRQYVPFMGPQYTPIPTSIISQGQDIWEGAGDRGDAAMFLQGCSRFVLTLGSAQLAEEFAEPLLWCAEYCRRHTLPNGVIASDSDELEGRFPSGEANLSTNCLCYMGLATTAVLLRELHRDADAHRLEQQRTALGDAIEREFAAEVRGFDTYRYYNGCEKLRSWICWPLCAGIPNHAAGTVDAVFSPQLWSVQGMLCEEGDATYWDRAALYALRGSFAQGFTEKAWPQLAAYTRNRLLGERAPYPIEAWPEGGMRHLSGESALYCRIVTEGILGIEPLGLHRFALTPRCLPGIESWSLENIHAFGTVFTIRIDGKSCRVVSEHGSLNIPMEERSVVEFSADTR